MFKGIIKINFTINYKEKKKNIKIRFNYFNFSYIIITEIINIIFVSNHYLNYINVDFNIIKCIIMNIITTVNNINFSLNFNFIAIINDVVVIPVNNNY